MEIQEHKQRTHGHRQWAGIVGVAGDGVGVSDVEKGGATAAEQQ